ncbi:MAG: lipopolysaccharide heptosyltransferase II [Acidobacteria bacterium]|nr:lipopolysaccharide heptosyltransferase II [Acidobacteriota bacterium]
MKQPGKILVRGTNWVGDAVMCIPALREIRNIFPEAHIALLVRPWVKEVYGSADFVDEIIEYDKEGKHRGWSGFFRLIPDLRKRRFDLALLLQNAFEAAFLAWCAGIPERIGYGRDGRSLLLTKACRIDPAVLNVHQSYYYLGILSSAGLIEQPLRLERTLSIRIGVREADRKSARALLESAGIRKGERIVGINPGASYGPAKRWFPDRYASVADRLAERFNTRTVIFGSAGDLAAAKEVELNMKSRSLILAGRTTLGQLMGLMNECALLITNDSGPMHLAAALDVPQLAIFGSTSEVATGPLSSRARVIKHQVECNPCFLKECPTDFRCMKEISVQRVVEAAGDMLQCEGRGQGE